MKRPFGRGTTLLRGLSNHGYWPLTNRDDPPSSLPQFGIPPSQVVLMCLSKKQLGATKPSITLYDVLMTFFSVSNTPQKSNIDTVPLKLPFLKGPATFSKAHHFWGPPAVSFFLECIKYTLIQWTKSHNDRQECSLWALGHCWINKVQNVQLVTSSRKACRPCGGGFFWTL